MNKPYYNMIKLEPFTEDNFQQLISWMHSKELLLTIAGNYFSYPLTGNQLDAYLKDTNSCAFNVIDTTETRIIGHAELYKKDSGMYKIDKLIIGDAASRGKGLCQPIMQLLIDYAFNVLHAKKIELNVFDWNTQTKQDYLKLMIQPGLL